MLQVAEIIFFFFLSRSNSGWQPPQFAVPFTWLAIISEGESPWGGWVGDPVATQPLVTPLRPSPTSRQYSTPNPQSASVITAKQVPHVRAAPTQPGANERSLESVNKKKKTRTHVNAWHSVERVKTQTNTHMRANAVVCKVERAKRTPSVKDVMAC